MGEPKLVQTITNTDKQARSLRTEMAEQINPWVNELLGCSCYNYAWVPGESKTLSIRVVPTLLRQPASNWDERTTVGLTDQDIGIAVHIESKVVSATFIVEKDKASDEPFPRLALNHHQVSRPKASEGESLPEDEEYAMIVKGFDRLANATTPTINKKINPLIKGNKDPFELAVKTLLAHLVHGAYRIAEGEGKVR